MRTNSDLLEFAIKNKKIIVFKYEGANRKAAPHHYGTLNGKPQLHAYQISGTSQTHKPVGWKNFEIKKMKDLYLDDHSFRPRPDHNPANSNYSLIAKSVVA